MREAAGGGGGGGGGGGYTEQTESGFETQKKIP